MFAFLIFFVLLILFVFLLLIFPFLFQSSDSLQILFGMFACDQVNFKVLLDEVLESSSTQSASSETYVIIVCMVTLLDYHDMVLVLSTGQ